MIVVVKTKPATGAITLAEAKEHLEIDSSYTENDADISSKIMSATSNMDSMTGKRTITQTIDIEFDSWKDLEYNSWKDPEPEYRLIHQGKIVSATLSYYDEDRVEQTVSTDDYEVVGIGSYEGQVVFNDTFDYPEVWGVRSVILNVIVGQAIGDIDQDFKTMVKLLLSEMMKGEDIEDSREYFRLENKYWDF